MTTRLCLVLLLLPRLLHSAELTFSWEFPRAYDPHPDRFVLTSTGSGGTPGTLHEHAVPWHPASACASLPEPGPDIFCARLPCPDAGLYVFWLAAEWGEKTSAKTNLLTCQIRAGDPTCQCTEVDQVIKDMTTAAQAAILASPSPLLASLPTPPSVPTPSAALSEILGQSAPT